MSAKPKTNQDVKDLIDNIINNHKLSKESKVTYKTGSDLGDGFLSQSLAVNISDDQQCLELFLKCGLEMEPTPAMPIHKLYANEIHFYEVVAPTYLKFVEEKNVIGGFRNIPKCYGTSTKNIIALENLKAKGYELCNKTRPMNDKHISLVLKSFAKFHAISFAFKDQRRKQYDKLIEPAIGVFDEVDNEGRKKMFTHHVHQFLLSLDPIKDKHILAGSDDLANKLFTALEQADKEKGEDAILTQGDCWCNNMMFLYEDENKEHPIDIILIDWQIIHLSLPVIDLSHFFYTVASEEALDNLKHYMNVYHEELSRQIRQLGSDPDVLYPFELMEQQWKEKSKFGLYMAIQLIRVMLSEKDETLDIADVYLENKKPEDIFPKLKNNDEYCRRIKSILDHMITNEFL